jgi:hypothetical protein
MDQLDRPVALTFTYSRKYDLTNRERPQIMVSFRRHGSVVGSARANLIVDSGSDVTMMPERYALGLGYPDVLSLPPRRIRGISGDLTAYGPVDLDALLCGKWVNVPVFFYRSADRVAMLGRSGAFDALHLAFVHQHRLLYASRAS